MDKHIEWEFLTNQPSKEIFLEWDKLCENNPGSVASSFSEFSKNSEELIYASEVVYALGYTNKDLVCAIPLFKKQKKICFLNCNVLQITNHNHLDMYIIPGQNLWDANQLFARFLKAIKHQLKHWDYFQARNLAVDTPLAESVHLPDYQNETAYFTVDNNLKITNIIPKKLLKNIDRLQKKLCSDSQELHLKTHNSSEEISEALDTFMEIEDSGWKGKSGTSIISDDKTHQFYKKTWQSFSETSKSSIYSLILGDTTIAAAIAFRHNDSIYLHKITYSEELTQFGPGSILIKMIIETALSDNTLSTLCLNTNPKWADRWHPKIIKLQGVESFNLSMKGIALKLLFTLYRTAKKIKDKIKQQKTIQT